jgi:hypothetical protein
MLDKSDASSRARALQKPLLAEPSAKVVEADMVANKAEAALTAIRADLLPHISMLSGGTLN